MGSALTITNDLLRRFMAHKKYPGVPDGRLGLVGIRGAALNGNDPGTREIIIRADEKFMTGEVTDAYDDVVGQMGLRCAFYRGTVDPGWKWTKAPTNPRGCAHLVPGAYLYRFGLHKGHLAFNQAGPVLVHRDRDRDGKAETHEPKERGVFGINIHAMGWRPSIDAWSAGCQGIAGGWQGAPWVEFYGTSADICRQIAPLEKTVLPYHLLIGAELLAFAKKL